MNKEIFYNYCPIIQFVDYYSNKWKATANKTLSRRRIRDGQTVISL